MVIRHSPRKFMVIGGLAAALLLSSGVVFYITQQRANFTLPPAIVNQTLFPIYVPGQLPSGFALDEKTLANNEGVLVFQLADGTGRSIAVTEQSIPANFDFADFYAKRMKDPRTIGGTPHHSVIGEMAVKQGTGPKLLSIRADATWVMVTGENMRDDELERIAQTLRKL